jgi:lipopolysaccharide transport system ATP-binding protein
MPPRVVFDAVWKKFRRGERHDSLRDLIPSLLARLTRGNDQGLQDEEFWALENVSFAVSEGKALGIIGPNGAGKSTSLKLLTKILRPSRGACEVHGRVGALIEVAAGFHPDLTGRENVFLQGAIMGMSRTDVLRRFDEIVEFAGVGAFVDTQIKRYSSGMNARLGFAIAAHLRPDVLIIDEVLSVGDMAFQQRCVERMFDFKRQGVAIVFVSHNLQAVADLCDEVLVLRRERLFLGDPTLGISTYVRSLEGGVQSGGSVDISAALVDAQGRPVEVVRPGDRLALRATFAAKTGIRDFMIAFRIVRSTDQLLVYDAHFPASELGVSGMGQGAQLDLAFEFTANLTRGQYHVESLMFEVESQRHLAWLRPAGLFAVEEHRTWGGVADVKAAVATAHVRQ